MMTNNIPGVIIEWKENPLESIVRLNDAGRKILRLAIKVNELEEILSSTNFELENLHKEDKTPEQRIIDATHKISLGYIIDNDELYGKNFSDHIEERALVCEEELLASHYGDCTCTACSCLKCHAEDMIGAYTIRDLGNHEAAHINGAFYGGKTISEVIEYLKNYKPVYQHNLKWAEEDWQLHVPRWIKEAERAHEWLVKYKQDHFP